MGSSLEDRLRMRATGSPHEDWELLQSAAEEIRSLSAQLAEAERREKEWQREDRHLLEQLADRDSKLATIERETLERAAKVADGFHTHSCDMAAAKIRALAQKPEASGEKEP